MLQTIGYLFLNLRPKQWIKNIIIFIPLIFSHQLFDGKVYFISFLVAICFSLFVGATYTFNDICDRKKDALHPIKSLRPIAGNKISIQLSLVWAIFLIGANSAIVWYIFPKEVFLLFVLYLFHTLIYTWYIKKMVILDVFSIAMGFVIRGLIGAAAIGITISEWFLIIVFFGALFLGFSKRFQEVKLGISSRANIVSYNKEFLEQILSMLASVLLFSYAMYTFNSSQSNELIYTLPIVGYGVIRYYYNIFYLEKYADGIEAIIYQDKHLLWTGIVYLITVLCVIYR